MQTSIHVLTLAAAGSLAALGCGGQIVVGGDMPADGGSLLVESVDGATSPVTPNTMRTLSVTTDPWSTAPNQEVWVCQVFSNPFLEDVDLISIGASGSTGANGVGSVTVLDVAVFALPPFTEQTASTTSSPCTYDPSGTEPMLYRATAFKFPTLTYPRADMGYRLSSQKSLLIKAHYLNASAEPLSGRVTISLGIASPGLVTTFVGNLLLVNRATPPAGTSTVVTASWTPPTGTFHSAYSIYASFDYAFPVWPDHGPAASNLSANAGGANFYEDAAPDYQLPLAVMNPVVMSPSQSIRWSCTFNPPSGRGSVPQYCTYQALYYPADPQNADLIEGL